MITIQNLEVQMEVEGDSDEAVFARLFDRYMRQWMRLAEETKLRQRLAEASRALGDRQSGESD